MTTLTHKTLTAKATATELGEFEAIAAAYTVDRQHEQIRQGAFTQTIAKWVGSGKQIPLHWNHSGEAADIIGTVDPGSMRETPEGLRVKGKLDLEDREVAREAWRAMKANSVGLSFGFMVTRKRKRDDGVLELQEIDLFEVSVTPAPANPDTRVLSMKSVGQKSDEELLAELTGKSAAQRAPIQIASFEL
jgi:HK97 family phage prohead protease